MADIWSIISSNYVTVGQNTSTGSSKYVAVDPTQYQGTWSGKYGNNTSFNLTVSQVNGFRAKVKYQSGSTTQYQDVLIKDGSFRIGDTKFSLQGNGTAMIGTAITDPYTGTTTLYKAYAQRS
jgi:hypothetical protein